MFERMGFAPTESLAMAGAPRRCASAALLRGGRGPMLPVGAGTSWGDCGTLSGGPLLDSRSHARIHDFDKATGTVTADAGVSLAHLLAHVAPTHVPPVLPGSGRATLGGAIACDIHGRNHHRRGSLGAHLLEITLSRSDVAGEITLRPGDRLFAATVGGLGMTGQIERARLRLLPVAGPTVCEEARRLKDLEATFAALAEAALRHEYVLASIDGLAHGASLGRGHLVVADHAPDEPRLAFSRRRSAIPQRAPAGAVARLARFLAVPRGGRVRSLGADAFFFGPDRGRPAPVHRHRAILPVAQAAETVRRLLGLVEVAGVPPALTLLQPFGANGSPGPLAFAQYGYALTLDLPARAPATPALLHALDRATLDAGGTLDPASDRHMTPETFARAFPDWHTLELARDPAILSDFWSRTALAQPGSAARP